MDTSNAAQALARVSAELTGELDVAGGLVVLLRGANATLAAQASGIMIENSRGRLELLAASSHEASELEVLQAQLDEGPCIEAHRTGGAVQAAGRGCLVRWPVFGPVMEKAGYASVHASPVRWQGSVIGGMGVFRRSDAPMEDVEQSFAQTFADLASVMIVNAGVLSSDELRERLDATLRTRIAVEQAKGILAEQTGLSMAQAHEMLVRDAHSAGVPLTESATALVARSSRGEN